MKRLISVLVPLIFGLVFFGIVAIDLLTGQAITPRGGRPIPMSAEPFFYWIYVLTKFFAGVSLTAVATANARKKD